MSKFERENRYLVIKRSDLDAALSIIDDKHKAGFHAVCRLANWYRASRGKKNLSCVVVEHDWPEYEATWEAIQDRVEAESTVEQ